MIEIKKVSTKAMTHEEWLEARRKSIGGSDVPAILGMSKFASPYSVWSEKTGKYAPPDISENEAVKLGTELEDYVARRFMESTGKKVRRENNILKRTDLDFAHANVDRLVVGEKAGLECKTTTSYEINSQCAAGKIPDHFYVQCCHYLMITGLEKWYLAVLVFGRGFYWFEVKRDELEIEALEQAERAFWELVENDTPPSVDGLQATTEALKTIYSESNGNGIDLTAIQSSLELYDSIGKQIDELEQKREEYANSIKSFMGESESGSCGSYSVSWKSSERKTFDRKAFEKDNGAIDGKYFKTSTTRTFKFTNKEK